MNVEEGFASMKKEIESQRGEIATINSRLEWCLVKLREAFPSQVPPWEEKHAIAIGYDAGPVSAQLNYPRQR